MRTSIASDLKTIVPMQTNSLFSPQEARCGSYLFFQGTLPIFQGTLPVTIGRWSRGHRAVVTWPSGGVHVTIGRWSLATSERKTGISPLGMICCVPVWSIYSVKKAEAFAPSRNPMSRKLLEGIEIANFYYLWK